MRADKPHAKPAIRNAWPTNLESGGTTTAKRSCVETVPHGSYDMMSPEEAEKFTYVRMKKVLLRRDVITAPFLAKFEAGQESARNKGDQHLPGTKRR